MLWAMMAVIYAPLIPAVLTLISPALSLTHWQALFADPQLPQALLATLVSTTIAAVGALLIALLVIVALWRAEMAAYVRPAAVAARHSPYGFCHQRPSALC
ncbi:hypothetical protein ECZU51_24450 [Escherichia coli]|nr:hypothetical protein ECZU51_24450 [Escherichia coli]